MTVMIQDAGKAKEIVKTFYNGAAEGRITDFASYLSEDFRLFVPSFLPWGGMFDRAGYVDLLPGVAKALDFAKLEYLSFIGEGGHVVALIEISVQGTDKTTIISEHWDVAGDKATQLRVAYYDPSILLETLGAPAVGA